jgi:hypothetical protein
MSEANYPPPEVEVEVEVEKDGPDYKAQSSGHTASSEAFFDQRNFSGVGSERDGQRAFSYPVSHYIKTSYRKTGRSYINFHH